MTAQQLLNDQRWIFQDFPAETVIIADIEYPCLALNVEDKNEWQDGGLLDTPDAAILIERGKIASLPAPGGQVIFRDDSWQIIAVHEDHPQAPLELSLRRAVK